MSPEKKASRYKRWESIGPDAIKADLETGGLRYVGGTSEVRSLAWQWVREKEAKKAQSEREVLSLKPTIYGIGMDLKAAWAKLKSRLGKSWK